MNEKSMEEKVHIDVSCSQDLPEGRTIRRFYRLVKDCLLVRGEFSGYPYDGGRHSLFLHMAPCDILAMTDLLKEYPSRFGIVWAKDAEKFVIHVQAMLKVKLETQQQANPA